MTTQRNRSPKTAPLNGKKLDPETAGTRRYCFRVAKHLLKLQIEKAQVFEDQSDLFGEPAWEILLNLYIAFYEGRRPIRREATMQGFIPGTTGLRILADLERRGLVKSERSATDGRLWLQSLTDDGVTRAEACLQTMVVPRRRNGPKSV